MHFGSKLEAENLWSCYLQNNHNNSHFSIIETLYLFEGCQFYLILQ